VNYNLSSNLKNFISQEWFLMDKFLKYFFVSFLAFTLILVGVFYGANKVGGVKIFQSEDDLMSQLPRLVHSDSPFFDAFTNSKRVNVLLIGSNKGMTDTMMLVSYDMSAQHVDVISIPRDTYYPRSGYSDPGSMKINAIYNGEGIVGTATAVSETLLGMPIHYYAMIDYAGVKNVVDAMGGIPMNIPFNMKYNDPYDTPPLVIDIPEGLQVLDGQHAVEFLRYRHGYPEGDIGRVRAQQEFIKSAFKQMMSLNLPSTMKTIIDNVDSDITLGMATKIATKAIGLNGESISTYLTPGTPALANGASYWFASAEDTAAMINEIYSIQPATSTTEPAVNNGN
jgi:LCP family protein required for cell wall assembly